MRELENTIERAVVLSHGPVIEAGDITMPGVIGPASAGLLAGAALERRVGGAPERAAGARARGRREEGRGQPARISQRALSYYLAKYRVEE